MIQREISGPQGRFERGGGMGYRDVRPLSFRFAELLGSQFSGLVLAAVAVAAYLYPAALDLLVPASVAYAIWVMRRHVKLPLRLPQSAGQLDWNYPSPKDRTPRMAAAASTLAPTR